MDFDFRRYKPEVGDIVVGRVVEVQKLLFSIVDYSFSLLEFEFSVYMMWIWSILVDKGGFWPCETSCDIRKLVMTVKVLQGFMIMLI